VATGRRSGQPRAPRGSVEPEDADDLERAAARELAEETGYEADSFERLTTVEPTNGIADSVHHHFLATGCEPTAEQDLDHNESIAVETVPYDDLLEAVVDEGLRDGRTVTAVLWYELLHREVTAVGIRRPRGRRTGLWAIGPYGYQ